MLVFLKDGTQLSFHIEASPRITFSDKNLKIVSTAAAAEIARDNILRFEFMSMPLSSVNKISDTSNFSIAMATAADTVIAEAEMIVELGEIAPEDVRTSGVFVDYVVEGGLYQRG